MPFRRRIRPMVVDFHAGCRRASSRPGGPDSGRPAGGLGYPVTAISLLPILEVAARRLRATCPAGISGRDNHQRGWEAPPVPLQRMGPAGVPGPCGSAIACGFVRYWPGSRSGGYASAPWTARAAALRNRVRHHWCYGSCPGHNGGLWAKKMAPRAVEGAHGARVKGLIEEGRGPQVDSFDLTQQRRTYR